MVNLIYDSAITGHHTEYISHLVDFLIKNPTEESYVFVVPEDIKNRFPEILERSKNAIGVQWDFIRESDCRHLEDSSLLKRSFMEYSLMKSFAVKYNASQVLLMYFNIFQIALMVKRPEFKVKGILFFQFARMRQNNWKDRLKYWRKFLTTKLYTCNAKITSVFVLNDEKTTGFLNKEFNTNIFKMLPDPIPHYNEEPGFDIYNYYNIPSNKRILLHAGTIDPRKGTFEILDAIDFISKEASEDYAIAIVGKAKEVVDSQIKERIRRLKNTNFCLVYENTFVSDERMKSLFNQSHAILIPYKNPEASSGILGHAILAQKYIIAPSTGLLGEVVKDLHCGITLERINGNAIAEAVHGLKTVPSMNVGKITRFVQDHSSINFAECIIKSYPNE